VSVRWIVGLLVLMAAAGPLQASGLERSVVRIVNFAQRGNWASPWDVSQVAESAGSGFVIEGGVVMTNAHVVSDSRQLLIYFHNDPDPHVAEVVHIGHDCDLALIRPLDPAPMAALKPLAFGGLPALGSTVNTLGYPAGGLQVSSTRGVVSRIEEQLYVHSGKDVHATVQTDAAINSGNSSPTKSSAVSCGTSKTAVTKATRSWASRPRDSRTRRRAPARAWRRTKAASVSTVSIGDPAPTAWCERETSCFRSTAGPWPTTARFSTGIYALSSAC
jgi:hypothetical protein